MSVSPSEVGSCLEAGKREKKRRLRKKGLVCGNSRSRSVLVIQNERTKELSFEKRQWAFERLPALRGFCRERDGSRLRGEKEKEWQW